MNEDDAITDVACIVVHHNSPATLVHTLQALIDCGLPRAQILVVDNSNKAARPGAPVGEGFSVLRTSNRGYAAAVNDGLAHLNSQGLARAFTLISTHESLPALEAVQELRGELLADSRIAAAGPTLLNADSDLQIWSVGGRLTRWLKLPRHYVEVDAQTRETSVDREWLDGAFTMYRTDALGEFKLDETYFLYFEETDLHMRLGRAGHRVVWVPKAIVSQSSSGIPPRLMGRNLFVFHSRFFSKSRGRSAVSFELLRAIARKALTSKGKWSDCREVAVGWRLGEKLVREEPPARNLR